ncbi:hypothetical protein, partial [Methylorubrum sp. SB2]|uniref:hypothetical protein n=1 Tax=Methylorubrum subtropicum TaxID=3138812 RepID=UPI00313D0063
VQAVGKERDLLTVLTCDEAFHPDLPRSGFTLPNQHVFTQPGSKAAVQAHDLRAGSDRKTVARLEI